MDILETVAKIFLVIGLFVIGILFIPKLVKKTSNKIYKNMKKEEIDFDNMGPKIVKKDEEK